MIVYLSDYISQYVSSFRVFEYLTFRAVLSLFTALFISLFFGSFVIKKLQLLHFGQVVRNDGPESHLKKNGTPTMGGILIVGSIAISMLLWCKLDNIYEILDEIKTISLFDNTKLIIISSLEAIVNVNETKLNELAKEMNNYNVENVLIFTSLKKLDFRINALSLIRRYSTLIDINTKNIPMDKYVNNYLKEEDFSIDNDALSLLLSYVGDLSTLKNSLEILMSYKLDEKTINIDDVTLMIRKPLDDDFYALIDQVLTDNKKMVFEIYNDMKTRNVAPTFIVSLLINKFHELYNAYVIADALRSKNEAERKVAEIFNVSEKRAYYMVKNTRNTNLKAILSNIKALDDLDYKIKSGLIDQNIGLELYFLR